MAVWYLDNDDEITDAVARLRSTEDGQVVFVVPPGSRIATGRINFKLLAREAEARRLSMAVASPDEQVRAMATSAGVLARPTPDQAEAALERGDRPTTPEADAAEPPTATQELDPSEPAAGGLRSWRSQRLRLTTAVLLAVAVVAGFVVTQAVPTAEVTLRPLLSTLGPLEVTVTASTDADAPDARAGAIPAAELPIELSASDEYTASGTESVETTARGEVVFSALDQGFDQEIAAGTRARTPAGTEFRTTESVMLPRTDGSGPTTVSAPVEALAGGEAGNVPAGAINLVPSLESQGISVTNPEPTSGGRSEERPLVTAADYDAAAVDLRNRLTGALAAYLRDPANLPADLTVYPESAVLGPVTLEPEADVVVGTTAESFTLAGTTVARVLGVDESLVDLVARTLLERAVPANMRLLPDSVSVSYGEGTVTADRVAFEGSASGTVTPVIDVDALAARIAGLPVSEAQAILDGLGTATVNVWPGFLGDLPDDRRRITLDVSEASTTE